MSLSPVTIPDNLTNDDLNRWARDRAGLLGVHPKSVAIKLERYCGVRWTIEWTPLANNPTLGTTKLRPLTDEATWLLDDGRANVLRLRHTWMPHEVARRFIRATKRNRKAHIHRVQDFLIGHWRDPNILEKLASKEVFFAWAKKVSTHQLSAVELDAIFQLMPRVRKTLGHRPRKKVKQ